ncbi:MAG: hypothetical protein NTW54_08835 [Bacteroidetes bacterium]|nr:hypothetical protein [Bacteroidota bacterium]
MRINLVSLLLCISFLTNAQYTQITATSLYDSLYSRVHRIECKLYDGVMTGKIKPFQNDSLTSTYSLQTIKSLGTIYHQVRHTENSIDEPDSVYQYIINPHDKGNGLLSILKPVKLDLNSMEDHDRFTSVALLFAPSVGNTSIILPIQPWFYIRYSDLAMVLNPSEIQLLTQLTKLLSTDKYFGLIRTKDSLLVTTRREDYFAPGVFNGFTRSACMNKENLEAVAKNCIYLSVLYIHEALLQTLRQLEKDPAALNTPTYLELKDAMTNPKAMIFFPNPDDPTIEIDSIFYARIEQSEFKRIVWDASSIGISQVESFNTDVHKSVVYISRNEFCKLSPQWLQIFLWSNF